METQVARVKHETKVESLVPRFVGYVAVMLLAFGAAAFCFWAATLDRTLIVIGNRVINKTPAFYFGLMTAFGGCYQLFEVVLPKLGKFKMNGWKKFRH